MKRKEQTFHVSLSQAAAAQKVEQRPKALKHGRFAPFVSFRPGCCRVPVCLIYEPARRRIANTMVVNAGKKTLSGSHSFASSPFRGSWQSRQALTERVRLPYAFYYDPSPEKVAQKRPQAMEAF